MPPIGDLLGLDRETSMQYHLRNGLQWKQYCLLLLDFLGSGEKLERWYPFSKNGSISAECLKSLSLQATSIVSYRHHLSDFIRSFLASRDAFSEARTDFSTSIKNIEALQFLQAGTVFTQQFGDSLLLFAPLAQPNNALNVRPLLGMIGAASFATLSGLSTGQPMRGAIDISLGIRFHDGDIYGPVLSHVHALESRCAGQPRVLVGSNLREFLATLAGGNGSSPLELMNRAFGASCQSFIHVDADGQSAVEFAGAPAEVLYNPGGRIAAEREAMNFVQQSIEWFSKQNNPRLVDRYARVRAYLDSRALVQ